MENVRKSKETAEELFFKFMDAQDCPEITSTFRELVKLLGIKAENPRQFYSLLKGKLQTWRCKSLWELLDSRANQKEYGKGKICEDIHVLVIGAGPIGLRTAVEVALLGAKVVIVEKRESFIRNNVLHLWPFLLTDFRSLGAKKFYGKFCSGSIDHISIRRLQAIFLKTALIFGAKLYTGVTFDHVIEPNSPEDGWKCKVSPESHPVSKYEFDVLIGADGKKNVIPGFQQIEMRGTLAIGITANFVNHCTEEEANVEEISGIAYQFNPKFFDDLLEHKGIKLENIVYYKDETHYFVMTAGKASLLKRGALKEDFGAPAKLLAASNIDYSKLLEYVTDVVKYATQGTLRNLELKTVGNNQPDIAAFDFTSIKKAEHAARIIERKGSKLLIGLVGDSLLEPFWPTGSGCARGVLSALDAAWMIRSFAQDKPPLQILSDRENIYRLLSGTSAENLHKDHSKYTINPTTRYLHITHKRIREVYHLFDTDDPVNADFSIGSPQTDVLNKASRKRTISTGAKFTSTKGRKRSRANSHLAADLAASRMRSTSGSSTENLSSHKALSSTRSVPLHSKVRAHTLSSVGSEDEVFQSKTRRVRIKASASPITGRSRSSTVGSSGDELKDKRKKSARKRTLSKEAVESPKARRKKGLFGFGRSKPKRKTAEDSDYHSDKDNKLFKGKRGDQHEKDESKFGNGVVLKSVQQKEEGETNFVREDSWKRRPAGSFSREQYTRRSARDIIREMEARSKGEAVGNENIRNGKIAGKPTGTEIQEKLENGQTNSEADKNKKNKIDNREMEEKTKIKKEDEKKKHKEEEKKRKEEERKKKDEEKRKHEEEKKRKEEEEKRRKKKEDEIKKREQANNLHNKRTTQNTPQTTPPNKKSKKQRLLDEVAALSPSARRAMPVLSTLSPEFDKENDKVPEHTVTSAVRDAAMLLLATPLLIDGMMPKKLNRDGSWLGKSSGRVRDVVHRYNTLNNMKPLIDKMDGDETPLKRPLDRVDGSEEKPRKIDNGEIIDNEGDNENESYTEEVKDSFEVKPTPPSEKKKALQMKKDEKHLISSPSLERLKIKLKDFKGDSPTTDKDLSPPNGQVVKDFSSPIWQKTLIAEITENNDKSIETEPVKTTKKNEQDSVDGSETATVSTPESEQALKDLTSPIWQKTAIAVVTESNVKNTENTKEAVNISTKNEEEKESHPLKKKPPSGRRRSSVLPSELMEEKLTNLLNGTTAQRAKESIKYMMYIFKQIQKHPNDEKYYRIFKERVRFRKHVWSLRNAKLFMTASGWTEIGSFVIFPLSKQIEGPLLLLNKYLSMAEEKSVQENSSPRKVDHQNLRRTSSTDLAERIMELKEALVSSKTNSNRTNKFSGNLKNRESIKPLQRAVSMDEVNISRRTNLETGSVLRKDSTDGYNELQKPCTRHLDEEKENAPAHLRRSVSENALHASSENHGELTPAFSLFTRRFSQRGVKEQEISCDVVMENPLNFETESVSKKDWQGSISSLDEEEIPKQTGLISLPQERQSVRSPQDAVLEEADQLSSVLGNLIDTLGSPTDSERESDSEREVKKKPQNGKVKGTLQDKHRDEELEALCETLDLLIHDNSSESSSESAKENIPDKKPYNRRPTEKGKTSFKSPLPPTRRTTQQVGKTKSLDNFEKSKRSSMASGRSNRDRVSKAKSADVAELTSNRRPREGTTDTRQNISRTAQKNTTERRESSVKTRAQRQKEARNSHVLDTSNRKEVVPSKRDLGAKASHRTEKRPALKVKSVDLERPRTRPSIVKSKSEDHKETGPRGTQRNRVKKGSGRSSSSEDDKKPPRLRIADQTRMKTRGQSSGRVGNRASIAKKSKGSGGRSSTEEDINKEPSKAPRENTTRKKASASKSSREEKPDGHNGENSVNIAKTTTFTEKASESNHLAIPEKDVTDTCTDAVINLETEIVEEITKEDANLKFVDQENEPLCRETDRTNHGLEENTCEIIKLSKAIQSHYGENNAQLNGDITGERKDVREAVPKVRQESPSDSESRDLVKDGSEPLATQEEGFHEEIDSYVKEDAAGPSVVEGANSASTQSQLHSRKMTLLDIGKQQSKDRLKRKEVVSLSLEERKQQILDAAVTKPKSKPADKRRSILQIKSRSDGNLVKNKKEAFEKPKVAHSTLDGSIAKTSKQRHFRFRGRKKKSFEMSSEPLEAVAEDQEEVFEEMPATNGTIPTNQANGLKAIGEEIEERTKKEKGHSPVKISPFQLRFTKRRGSYDLEKRSSLENVESPKQRSSEHE